MFNLTPYELEQREKNRQLQRRVFIETVKDRVKVISKKKSIHHHPFMPSANHPTEMLEVLPEFESDEKRKAKKLKALEDKAAAKVPKIIRDAESGDILSFTNATWTGFEGKINLTPAAILQRGTGKIDVLKEHCEALPIPSIVPNNPLVPFVEQVGPVTVKMHKGWDPKTRQVTRLPTIFSSSIGAEISSPLPNQGNLSEILNESRTPRDSGESTKAPTTSLSLEFPNLQELNAQYQIAISSPHPITQRSPSLRFQPSYGTENDSTTSRSPNLSRGGSKSLILSGSPIDSARSPTNDTSNSATNANGPFSPVPSMSKQASFVDSWSLSNPTHPPVEPLPLPALFVPTHSSIQSERGSHSTAAGASSPFLPTTGRASPSLLHGHHGTHHSHASHYEALQLSYEGMEWANSVQNWKHLEERYYQEIVQTVCDLEKNKSLTHEPALTQKAGLPSVKATCRKLARMKAMGMFQVAQAIYDEELREAARQKALEHSTGGPLRLAKLKEDHHKERIAKQEYIESLRRDNEIIFLTKVAELDWLW